MTHHTHFYNPDWLSDDALVAGFVARQDEFHFLRDELAHAPLQGSVQHHLLIGLRGAGKTTLLKRLAVAIRRDDDLKDHLIALSFPEELYQVKHLADFWWAACEALVDELDRRGQRREADQLSATVEQARPAKADASQQLADTGLALLQQTCQTLARRPVLLVDNLDMVFERIDKSGRKLSNPHAPAYWALREALSTASAPIVIGGSVRLTEPFTDYDKAFYDFFLPRRLGKLSLSEVRGVLQRLAQAQNTPEVTERLHQRPARIEALYELTGGNPRAVGLIFELLRTGANSRAVEDFERLMDITTPYYKARFEDLSEQAQVVMHALAVRRPGDDGGLRFGHTAAEIASHAGVATSSVSAQLDTLEREGLVEKNAHHGRTQYRMAEQLFRLWLQMRANRRIRQNVIGLTEFLEAMFSFDEMQQGLTQGNAAALNQARLSFAVAGAQQATPLRRSLEAQGAAQVLEHLQTCGDKLDTYFAQGDLPADMHALVKLRADLRQCPPHDLSDDEQTALVGSVQLRLDEKQAFVAALCDSATAPEAAAKVRERLKLERNNLLRYGLHEADFPLLYERRAAGLLPLPDLRAEDVQAWLPAFQTPEYKSMVWRLIGAWSTVKFTDEACAQNWLKWGKSELPNTNATEWAHVTSAFRYSKRLDAAKNALNEAMARDANNARVWCAKAILDEETGVAPVDIEASYHHAIALDPTYAAPWYALGIFLDEKLHRSNEAETAYRKAIELDPKNSMAWNTLGLFLRTDPRRNDEAEAAFRKSIDIDPTNAISWSILGYFLQDNYKNYMEAESFHLKAINLDPNNSISWHVLGELYAKLNNLGKAKQAFAEALRLEPEPDPYFKEQHALLQARITLETARQCLSVQSNMGLLAALEELLTPTQHLALVLNSEFVVEQFLAPVLAQKQQAGLLLDALRAAGLARHARPLLLAYEAALVKHPEMLGELEPEVRGAALRMHQRLTTPAEAL